MIGSSAADVRSCGTMRQVQTLAVTSATASWGHKNLVQAAENRSEVRTKWQADQLVVQASGGSQAEAPGGSMGSPAQQHPVPEVYYKCSAHLATAPISGSLQHSLLLRPFSSYPTKTIWSAATAAAAPGGSSALGADGGLKMSRTRWSLVRFWLSSSREPPAQNSLAR